MYKFYIDCLTSFKLFVYLQLGADKNVQFQGMEAAIEVLCKLDGKSNIMDYTQLFDPTVEVEANCKEGIL